MKTTNPLARHSVSHSAPPVTSHYPAAPKPSEGGPLPRRSFSEGGSLFTILLLSFACFALCSALQAVTPPPDGAYPGANTAEGQNALQSLTSGINNTALGFQALYHDATGSNNAAIGFRALYSDTTGVNNTATGSQALLNNTTGNQNTANGYVALSSNTTGGSNTATGSGALHSNTSAGHNTATGYIALYNNTTGGYNTATGDRALYSNTTGTQNTANGYQALNSNTTGYENTANGVQALYENTTGFYNTANGFQALRFNTTGGLNTAIGWEALINNTTDGGNTATGAEALRFHTTGASNTADGFFALPGNGSYNTAVGASALGFNEGNGNIALGYFAGFNLTTGDNNIDIGNQGVAAETDTIRIGDEATQTATFIAGIYGVNEGGTPLAVYINSNGQLGTMSSSRRFKKEIKPMDQTSQAILGLKPVTFQYKSDTKGTTQFGLIAEEVAQVNPDLVVGDANGEIYTVRYEAVNVMLLNEFLKEHRKVQDLEATVAQQQKDSQTIAAHQQKRIDALTARLDKQASQIQQVSAQLAAYSSTRLDVIKPAPQIVLNSQ